MKLIIDVWEVKKKQVPKEFIFFGWDSIQEKWLQCWARGHYDNNRIEIMSNGTSNINITHWSFLTDVPQNGEENGK